MRAVVQRVKEASVEVDGVVVGSIDIGLLVLVGGVLYIGWKYRTLWSGQAAHEEAACINTSLPDSGEPARSEIPGDQHMAEDMHDEITKIVRQNPEAAAELIRKWLDKAA